MGSGSESCYRNEAIEGRSNLILSKKGKLKYPNSNEAGVEIQLYFLDDSTVVETEKGNYYRDKIGDTRYVNEYDIRDKKKEKQPSDPEIITYIIQVHTQFDYWYKLD